MRLGLVAGVVCVGLLGGCTPPVPIVAKIDASKEEFIGAADPMKGEISGVIYPSGVTCDGKYEMMVTWSASTTYTLDGKIACADGRKGVWSASGSNNIGRGTGTLDGKLMKISFGSVGIMNSY